MAVKECRVGPRLWRDPIYWRNKLPREISLHKRIDLHRVRGTTHRNVIQHRGYRLMMRQRRYRLYLQFCSGGTLYDVMEDRWDERSPGEIDDNQLEDGLLNEELYVSPKCNNMAAAGTCTRALVPLDTC